MPRLEYAQRFARDLAKVTSEKVEKRIFASLENIELFGYCGSKVIPKSIKDELGEEVRKVPVGPLCLVYSFYPEEDLARIEALIHEKQAY